MTGKLTRTEKRVLSLIAEGKTTAEVATLLYITNRTVHFHVASIFTKLGTHTRIQAINAARERGLL